MEICFGHGQMMANVVFFDECVIVFQASTQFLKNKDVSNTGVH